MQKHTRNILLVTAIILAFSTEILAVYFLLPFSFSQKNYVPGLAYFFYHNIEWLRIVAGLLAIYPTLYIFKRSATWKKILLCACFCTYTGLAYYAATYLKAAEKYQPLRVKTFSLKNDNAIGIDKQVIGVLINGEAKAYPIQLISYHHFINDTIGGTPVIITYCSICRSARVYSPVINNAASNFELIGVTRFNALLQDAVTKSWWQQATGLAIAGPMKGSSLAAISFKHVSLFSWLQQYPASRILQPDVAYAQQYILYDYYEKSAFKGNAVQTDTATYTAKSLVIGFCNKSGKRSYDWNKLSYAKLLEDSLPGLPVLITVENDNTSFHVWKRNMHTQTLQFKLTDTPGIIKDINTSSVWNMNGVCVEGELKDTRLTEIQSYQETRESWNKFNPDSKEEELPTY